MTPTYSIAPLTEGSVDIKFYCDEDGKRYVVDIFGCDYFSVIVGGQAVRGKVYDVSCCDGTCTHYVGCDVIDVWAARELDKRMLACLRRRLTNVCLDDVRSLVGGCGKDILCVSSETSSMSSAAVIVSAASFGTLYVASSVKHTALCRL